jgi:integrase
MPHLSNGRGSLILKVKFRGLPKIRRATGVSDPSLLADLRLMCKALFRQGRLDLLEAIARGRLTPLQVYSQWRQGREVMLPPAEVLPRLKDAWAAWAKRIPGDDHRRSVEASARRLNIPADATLVDLPQLLLVYKRKSPEKGRSINVTRAHARAFLRDMVGSGHPLYIAVKDIRPAPKTKRKKGSPHSVQVIREVCGKLTHASGDPRIGLMCWTMAATGMGNKEYWRDGFEELTDRVLVHGQKREGRDREIPRWTLIGGPVCGQVRFRSLLKNASGGLVSIYDLRRCFARWCEEAGIIETNKEAYMGHGATTMSRLYTFGQLPGQLDADAAKLTAYAGSAAPVLVLKATG